MGKLFGTDGIRGIANESLDCALAFRVGQAAAIVLAEEKHHKTLFVIGKDTRLSSDMLEAAMVSGLCAAGADVILLGVIPTPAVAYLTVLKGADAGVVISASHNPYEHNGIKIFNGQGFKLFDEVEEKIERLVLSEEPMPVRTHGEIGRVVRMDEGADIYIRHVAGDINLSGTGLKIAVDCSNGAASRTVRALFDLIGVKADFFFDQPDGVNINNRCGSTHLKTLCQTVRDGGYDAGIAFDGDADRCLLVDEKGHVVDGDQIMAMCGVDLKKKGKLKNDTIVATVMSNMGFHVFARDNGIRLVTAAVGDRNVLEEMLKGDYVLGGEQSGHLIFLEHSTTGDGQMTAVRFLDILAASGKRVSQLMAGIEQYPQVLVNVPVRPEAKYTLTTYPAIKEQILSAEKQLGGDGRVLVRPSGTEALVRVMVEGREKTLVDTLAARIAEEIKNSAGM